MVRYSLGDQPISLELSDITRKELDLTDSSFFSANSERRLPTTAEVRALSKDIGIVPKPVPIIYEDLGLIVKFGSHTTVTEALNLWMIKKVFGDDIPAPEVFGWRVDDKGYVFIYMELIKGPRLGDCWDQLSKAEKVAMKDQLSRIMERLRSLAQDPSDKFIGSIDHGQLLDYVFIDQPKTGPFPSIKTFNDWFALLHQLRFKHKYDDPNRCLLPDNGEIKLTHCDLNRHNMIVASTSPARLVLIAWEQAGWYPDYWEYCKALYTCFMGTEWHTDYIDKFLQPRTDVYDVFSEYTMAMGAGLTCTKNIT
ncbi:hypothetical protein BO82DRAFT_418729 [Aspergillus uvarum CBS 121591]|uniref:Phosphotransferase enzyme family protein n=1 Tax=Aspergillus uvarum CBS 121591 TaxID=1448315 RepID=A0A319E595_9EURO|nr:hypothetical protein BO82DRAFT_418729 [Aspergillus uvarum CBS 121591]PYH86282.1 hypothetical protein BO82DRAFT_418729 [Aspergillus uvarum CBS 121591]